MTPPLFVLASIAPPPDKSSRLLGDVLPWLILLVGLIIAGGVAIYYFRRWMDHETSSSGAGFTLHDLRSMHARGELTDEQFQAARSAMIGRLHQPATTPPRGLSDVDDPPHPQAGPKVGG